MTGAQLKPGWRIVKFGDIAQNVAVRVDPADAKTDVYVGLEHLDPSTIHLRQWGHPSDVTGQKLAFKKGDVIFGRRRAYQRKLAVSEFDGICSAHAMVVRAKPKMILPEFLPFFLQSDMFMERAIEISVGSLSPTINWTVLREQEFPLPTLDEQKRIAEILWAADEAMEHFVTLESEAEKTRRVTLFEFMENGAGTKFRGLTSYSATGPWKVKRVSKAGDIQLGRQRAPKYQSGKWTRPYLRVANVFDGYFDLKDVLSMDFDDRDFARYELRSGDILLNEGQSRELVGRCAMFEDQIEGCCFQNTLIRFRCGHELIPKFAFSYFQYLFYRQTFAAVARQTTSIAHLGADTFQKLFMPIPPVDEQRKIASVMDRFNTNKKGLARQRENIQRTRQVLINDLTSGTHV